MFKLRVPATSANLGSGFDSIGVALSLYNYVTFEESDRVLVECDDDVPKDEHNLIIDSAKRAYAQAGRPFYGLHIIQENYVPLQRGLGSSSTCISAGVAIASALMGDVFSLHDKVTLAAMIEGHPDNVAPATLGGYVAAVLDHGEVYYQRKELDHDRIAFVAVVPDFRVCTEEARAALPKQLLLADAVYNLSRSSLLTAAFLTENYGLLRIAAKDRLHQQHRLKLVAGGEEIMRTMLDCGAYSATVSGAGPTLLATVPGGSGGNGIYEGILAHVQQHYPNYEVIRLQADNAGLVVI
ncbi:MAG: homoserine kinase [Clostridiales bacterium]|nr:homoserine kinase [Clostridiales bacterium]